jgi:tripartite-type tricarboxylate transporter receptor subunit TctC
MAREGQGMPMRAILLAAGIVGLLIAPADAQSVAEFYGSKQITLIVGSTTGGGYDTQGRLVARHIGRHIPGNPTVIVQNMPAAGSLAATNHMFNIAPKDGSTIALVQRGMLLIKNWNPTQVRFDLGRFNFLGSVNREVAMAVSRADAPVKTAQQLFTTELITGATSGIDPEITPRLLNALIGTKFKLVMGYPGVNEIVLAMERGEVQALADWSISSIKVARPTWIPEKKINLLMQIALERSPEFPQVPFALDFVRNDEDRRVMELYLTQKTVARPVIAPPGVPADRVAALRTAFAALAQDEGFLADARKAKLDVDMVPGAEVDKVISVITSASAETAARLQKAIASVR